MIFAVKIINNYELCIVNYELFYILAFDNTH